MWWHRWSSGVGTGESVTCPKYLSLSAAKIRRHSGCSRSVTASTSSLDLTPFPLEFYMRTRSQLEEPPSILSFTQFIQNLCEGISHHSPHPLCYCRKLDKKRKRLKTTFTWISLSQGRWTHRAKTSMSKNS